MKQIENYFLISILILLISCNKTGNPGDDDYKSIMINSRTWMLKNLSVDFYKNGDPIRYCSTDADWKDAAAKKEGAWCWYNNDSKNGEIYGRLYNWYAVADPRGLAPTGWHIPSDAEWTELSEFLGSDSVSGGKLKEIDTLHWKAPNFGATNSAGFTALPGGYRFSKGNFYSLGETGHWWTFTETDTIGAWLRYCSYRNVVLDRSYGDKSNGMSVRCIKNILLTE